MESAFRVPTSLTVTAMQPQRVGRVFITRAITITWLAIAAGCSQPDSPESTATPTAATSPKSSAVAGAARKPASSPTPQSDSFLQAIDSAISAATLTQSAVSKDDWKLIVSQWQRAISLLKFLPTSHPKRVLANQKIVEYQRNLAYAQQQAARVSKPNTSPSTTAPVAVVSKTTNANTIPSVSAAWNFLVLAGGGAPSYNEIALEKNVLYFQRTLETLGFNPTAATIFFANGNDGQATVRYINEQREQQFKVPEIPFLKGAATLENFQRWIRQTASQTTKRPIFFYFTGHGSKNNQDVNNNGLILWQGRHLTVQELANQLDELPQDTPVVTMMAQCYAGSFANFIYQGGIPRQPVALRTRCGFFATVSTRTSVGCTPEVNEADYEDYSSSFFAGLSGRSRTGESVPSADYNQDGRVSYAEAHAFAKVDEKASDWPISTSEAWLQSKASPKTRDLLLSEPMTRILQTARPEQRHVVESIAQMFNLDMEKSLIENRQTLSKANVSNEEQGAYLTRLQMELINIGMEKNIRTMGYKQEIAILDRLIKCEGSSWGSI